MNDPTDSEARRQASAAELATAMRKTHRELETNPHGERARLARFISGACTVSICSSIFVGCVATTSTAQICITILGVMAIAALLKMAERNDLAK